jgi:isoamylase
VKQLTSLRQKYPLLRYNRFYTGEYNGIKDLTWINANGKEMEDKNWGDSTMRCFGMLMDGRAQPSGIRKRGGDATLLLIINGHDDLVDFTLPDGLNSNEWCLLIDTNREQNDAAGVFTSGEKFGVTNRSLLIFVLQSGQDASKQSTH